MRAVGAVALIVDDAVERTETRYRRRPHARSVFERIAASAALSALTTLALAHPGHALPIVTVKVVTDTDWVAVMLVLLSTKSVVTLPCR
jgi:hypothetical protein